MTRSVADAPFARIVKMEPHTDYRELLPAEPLRDFVECYWTARRSTAGRVRVLPDGCADLLVDQQGKLRFVSTMTTAAVVDAPAGRRLFAVRFKPGGAAALLDVSMPELVDFAGSWSLLSPQAWDAAAEDMAVRGSIAVMQGELSKRAAKTNDRLRLYARLAQAVVTSPLSVSALAEELSITRQHLSRSVRIATGLSAKQLGRIGRLRRLTSAAPTEGLGANAALSAGYFDQAHMVNEFRALTGTTPGRYLREQP